MTLLWYISAKDYLLIIDEKFTDEDLNEIGNEFAMDYYGGNSDFSRKYADFGTDNLNYVEQIETKQNETYRTIYHFDFTEEHSNNINKIICNRFAEWKMLKEIK